MNRSMQIWFGRFTFSFLIIAAACGFEVLEAYRGNRPGRAEWKNVALIAAAGAGTVLFLAAAKVRYRRDSGLGRDLDSK